MIRSWWRRVVAVLIVLLITAGSFFGWTTFNYSHQIQKTIETENSNSVALWINLTSSRLGTLYEHIYELLLTLYNNTELRVGTPIMNEWTKKAVVDMMEDKLLISGDADAFFVYDTQDEFFLFSAGSTQTVYQVLGMKEYARNYGVASAEAFRDQTWKIVPVEQNQYFFKSVQLGKYIVGAFSDLDKYQIDKDFSVLGAFISFELLIDDISYPCGSSGASEVSRRSRNDILISREMPILDGTAVLTVRSHTILDPTDTVSIFLVVDSALCVVLVVFLLLMLRKDVVRPTKNLMRANQTLAAGNTDHRLVPEEAGSAEFASLYESFNEMAEQIVQLRIEAYDLTLQEQQNKLTMLRAQIRPHSFLKAITTISNKTYMNKPEEIRSYINSFAKFIRYMLNVNSSWTTVEDEAQQITNYLKMQQNRFPESVSLTVDYPPELAKARIPFLLLFTLVENSIKHAMTLYEPLEVKVSCRRVETDTFRGICLTEEDNGAGFSQEVLEKLADVTTNVLNTKDHLGLSNVRYPLHLVYGRDDLLRASNRETGGAHVELWIPDQEAEQ